jgi:hypothetical protein
MNETNVESLFKPSPEILSEVVPYRDGVVTISADTSRLRLDFLREVHGRPHLDLKEAEKIAENLSFFTDSRKLNTHISSDMRRWGADSRFWRMLGPASKPVLKLADMLRMGDLIGATYAEEAAPALFLNPDNMVAHAGAPVNANPEIVEAAIIHNVHKTWRHEREHLIRIIDPMAKEEDKRTKIARAVTAGTVSGLLTFGSFYFIPVTFSGDPLPDALNGIRLIATPVYSIVGSQLVADGLWYGMWNSAERAANLQVKTGKNLPSLFDFQFEKSK